MIELIQINFDDILSVWSTKLWPTRTSTIESHSAMIYNSDKFDTGNFLLPAWYYGLYEDNTLIGVNSGHLCTDGSTRSRGLWVDPEYRGKGYGKLLLCAIIHVAITADSKFLWSFPRKTSWHTYESAGFILTSEWSSSETSDANAYCYLTF